MSILFNQIVFGPIQSRRFGSSLGINLLPLDNKICNFNCIYCECGWTDLKSVNEKFFSSKVIIEEVEKKFKVLIESKTYIDCITFAGNGEPTMHPYFFDIIEKIIVLRDIYFPEKKIVVLSNSALLGNKKVLKALQKVDLRVLKLDAGTNDLFLKINKPLSSKKIGWYIEKLKEFNGDLIIQTIFLRGNYENQYIDNIQENELKAWLFALGEIRPKLVMIYTIDRDTPANSLEKIPNETLESIAEKVRNIGIDAKVY
jgi:wyosine [tRNA(Phe)-imidazoG37] synthetase (radical SAM superfamily)